MSNQSYQNGQQDQGGYQANPDAGTDLVAYAVPDVATFEEMGKGGGGSKKYLRVSGKSADYPGVFEFVLRPMPAPRGRKPMIIIWRHLYQLPNGRWFGHLCPINMGIRSARCFSCEKRSEVSARNPLDDEAARQMEAREIALMNVIYRGDEERGPVIHEGHWSFGKAASAMAAEGINPFDPSPAGHDIRLSIPRKKGDRYTYSPLVKASPLHPDAAQLGDWIAMAANLEEEARVLPFDHQQQAYEKALASSDFPGGDAPAQGAPRQGGYPTQPAQGGGYAPRSAAPLTSGRRGP